MAEQNETLAVLNTRLGALHDDVGEMKTVLNKLTDAITKLALIEQQQAQTAGAIERAFKTIEKIEARMVAVEAQMPLISRTNGWVEKAVLAAAAAGAGGWVVKIFGG